MNATNTTIAKMIIEESRNNMPFSTVFCNAITGTLTTVDILDCLNFLDNYPNCPDYIRIIANGNPENLKALAEESLIDFLSDIL